MATAGATSCWRNDAGLAAIWDLNDTTIIGGGAVAAVPTNWHIIV